MTRAETYLLEHLKRIPHGEWLPGGIAEFQVRENFVGEFGFAILTAHMIDVLKRFSPIIEVGSGKGYWASELKGAGVDVVATDPGIHKRPAWKKPFTDIVPMNGEAAVAQYPGRTLLMVWPDYNLDWPVRTLKAYAGGRVIYVGEGHGGCTADDAFHELLDKEWELQLSVKTPQFSCIHDRTEIWRRL